LAVEKDDLPIFRLNRFTNSVNKQVTLAQDMQPER